MKYRKLRFGWSVVWGVAAVFLIVLWVRSYWKKDSIYRTYSNGMSHYFTSNNGVMLLSPWPIPLPLAPLTMSTGWKLRSDEVDIRLGGTWGLWPSGSIFVFPYFAPVLLSAALAAASLVSWRRRFSLRTLLIATTLVAVGLGLIVYSMGK